MFLTEHKHKQHILLSLLLIAMGLTVAVAALGQGPAAPEPGYQFLFVPLGGSAAQKPQQGSLEVQALPPGFDDPQALEDTPVPVNLSLSATLFDGDWLQGPNGRDDEELTEAEAFVRGKFVLFQTAQSVEQFRDWLDDETYSTFAESVSSGVVNLANDREFYQQYGNIRLLGSIHYGYHILLYTQFRVRETDELFTSVMPVRRIEGKLLTAGRMHANSHELYRMLAFGSLQRQLIEFLEQSINN